MSLPPGFLDELQTRISIAQVVGRKVMWDQRKSNQAKGDMWAPCPFHQEKTASFHVDDRKGYYYCFGCHAKGDAISFVRETENVGFMEAVEILAREVGMTMPARDPKAAAQADRNTQLAEATEAAVRFFRMQLRSSAGAAARDYLSGRRGLSEATLDRFEIGYAPPGWQTTFEALTAKGIAPELLAEAGICPVSQKGKPFDFFRDRIMFPIRDARGRCIGFGGRAMDPGEDAKYLNTRETPLFDKGRALYNIGPAREAAGKGEPLIVAEGYMDVVALAQAGFGAAVAPLGTAITPEQLQMMWRVADEPVIALDGDAAGIRAAHKAIDVALPMLAPGKSLRFAVLPDKLDPDEFIAAKGADAMRALIDEARPLIAMLWERETDGQRLDTPERRAAFDARLRQVLSQIGDPSLRRHYGDEFRDLRWQLFRGTRKQGQRSNRRGGPREAERAPAASTRTSPLTTGAMSEEYLRAAVVLATLCRYPALIERFERDLERMTPSDPELARLATHLLDHAAEPPEAVRDSLDSSNLTPTLEKLRALGHLQIARWLRADNEIDMAVTVLTETFAKLEADRAIRHEMTEALEDLDDLSEDAHLSWRIRHAIEMRRRAEGPGDVEDVGADAKRKASLRLLEEVQARISQRKQR